MATQHLFNGKRGFKKSNHWKCHQRRSQRGENYFVLVVSCHGMRKIIATKLSSHRENKRLAQVKCHKAMSDRSIVVYW